MAAVSAMILAPVLGSVAFRRKAAAQSVARFNGLRACPMLRLRATACSRVARQRLTVTAAADTPTLQAVQKIIAKQLAVAEEKVRPESTFTDLGADSLDTVEIMMAIEEEFDVSFEDERAEKVSTVQQAADLIFDAIK